MNQNRDKRIRHESSLIHCDFMARKNDRKNDRNGGGFFRLTSSCRHSMFLCRDATRWGFGGNRDRGFKPTATFHHGYAMENAFLTPCLSHSVVTMPASPPHHCDALTAPPPRCNAQPTHRVAVKDNSRGFQPTGLMPPSNHVSHSDTGKDP